MTPTTYSKRQVRVSGFDWEIWQDSHPGSKSKRVAWFRDEREADAYLEAKKTSLDFLILIKAGIEILRAQGL